MKLSPNSRGTLIVRPQGGGGHDPLALPRRIQVIDGSFALVGKGFGELRQDLPVGIYRIQVESRSAPFETTLLVRPDEETLAEYPETEGEKLPSPVPVPGSQAMHETVYYPFLEAWENLRKRAKKGHGYVLLVFTAEQPGQYYDLSRIRLRDPQGKTLGLIKSRARIDARCQCATALVPVAAGGCILEWPDENLPRRAIRQPLWVLKDWCTVVFTGIKPETGRLNPEKLSIYHWKPLGHSSARLAQQVSQQQDYDTQNLTRSLQNTELALQSLITRRQLLSFQQEHSLLMEKYDNPMLGILGCHMLLQRNGIDHALTAKVIGNLDKLVPGHPDVAALKVMARKAQVPLPDSIKQSPATWPPMLRAGMAALIHADWTAAETSPATPYIQPKTFCDRVRGRIFSGGIWTQWPGDAATGDREFDKKPEATWITRAIDWLGTTAEAAGPFLKTAQDWVAKSKPLFARVSPDLLAQIYHFGTQLKKAGGKLTPEDLKWTGLNPSQLQAILPILEALPDIIKLATAQQQTPPSPHRPQKTAPPLIPISDFGQTRHRKPQKGLEIQPGLYLTFAPGPSTRRRKRREPTAKPEAKPAAKKPRK